MSSLKDIKSNRKASFEKLSKQVEDFTAKKKTNKTYEDRNEGFWQPTVDKVGNGKALIRFLPVQNKEEDNIVRLWRHAFQGPTGLWYIENSLSTLGREELKDPVGEYNNKLWNQGSDDEGCPYRKQARNQARKLEYTANIYVVKDYGNPENDGKVFHYRFGKKIFDKIQSSMFPTDEDIELNGAVRVDPFDMWDGANFLLDIKKVSGYRNYDDSKFVKPSPLAPTDAAIEVIWKQTRPVAGYVTPDKFKSYEELKAKLDRVLGESTTENTQKSLPSASAPKQKEKPARRIEETLDDDVLNSEGFDSKSLADLLNDE